MSLFRGIDDSDARRSTPDAPVEAHEELRRVTRTRVLGVGTLACARCDAPVALAGATVRPADPLSCPFCLHEGRVRDFLSLGDPTRPARVEVRIVGPRHRRPVSQALPRE